MQKLCKYASLVSRLLLATHTKQKVDCYHDLEDAVIQHLEQISPHPYTFTSPIKACSLLVKTINTLSESDKQSKCAKNSKQNTEYDKHENNVQSTNIERYRQRAYELLRTIDQDCLAPSRTNNEYNTQCEYETDRGKYERNCCQNVRVKWQPWVTKEMQEKLLRQVAELEQSEFEREKNNNHNDDSRRSSSICCSSSNSSRSVVSNIVFDEINCWEYFLRSFIPTYYVVVKRVEEHLLTLIIKINTVNREQRQHREFAINLLRILKYKKDKTYLSITNKVIEWNTSHTAIRQRCTSSSPSSHSHECDKHFTNSRCCELCSSPCDELRHLATTANLRYSLLPSEAEKLHIALEILVNCVPTFYVKRESIENVYCDVCKRIEQHNDLKYCKLIEMYFPVAECLLDLPDVNYAIEREHVIHNKSHEENAEDHLQNKEDCNEEVSNAIYKQGNKIEMDHICTTKSSMPWSDHNNWVEECNVLYKIRLHPCFSHENKGAANKLFNAEKEYCENDCHEKCQKNEGSVDSVYKLANEQHNHLSNLNSLTNAERPFCYANLNTLSGSTIKEASFTTTTLSSSSPLATKALLRFNKENDSNSNLAITSIVAEEEVTPITVAKIDNYNAKSDDKYSLLKRKRLAAMEHTKNEENEESPEIEIDQSITTLTNSNTSAKNKGATHESIWENNNNEEEKFRDVEFDVMHALEKDAQNSHFNDNNNNNNNSSSSSNNNDKKDVKYTIEQNINENIGCKAKRCDSRYKENVYNMEDKAYSENDIKSQKLECCAATEKTTTTTHTATANNTAIDNQKTKGENVEEEEDLFSALTINRNDKLIHVTEMPVNKAYSLNIDMKPRSIDTHCCQNVLSSQDMPRVENSVCFVSNNNNKDSAVTKASQMMETSEQTKQGSKGSYNNYKGERLIQNEDKYSRSAPNGEEKCEKGVSEDALRSIINSILLATSKQKCIPLTSAFSSPQKNCAASTFLAKKPEPVLHSEQKQCESKYLLEHSRLLTPFESTCSPELFSHTKEEEEQYQQEEKKYEQEYEASNNSSNINNSLKASHPQRPEVMEIEHVTLAQNTDLTMEGSLFSIRRKNTIGRKEDLEFTPHLRKQLPCSFLSTSLSKAAAVEKNMHNITHDKKKHGSQTVVRGKNSSNLPPWLTKTSHKK